MLFIKSQVQTFDNKMLFSLYLIHRALDSKLVLIGNMSVNHCRLNTGMAQKLLYGSNVIPVFNEMRGKGVAQRMNSRSLCDPGLHNLLSERFLQCRRIEMMAPDFFTNRIYGQLIGWK